MALMLNKPDKMSFVISGIGHAMGACLGSGVDVSFKKLRPISSLMQSAISSPDGPRSVLSWLLW